MNASRRVRAATELAAFRPPMSGLPDIGILSAQVGYSRLAVLRDAHPRAEQLGCAFLSMRAKGDHLQPGSVLFLFSTVNGPSFCTAKSEYSLVARRSGGNSFCDRPAFR
jgi:hypothetical protein